MYNSSSHCSPFLLSSIHAAQLSLLFDFFKICAVTHDCWGQSRHMANLGQRFEAWGPSILSAGLFLCCFFCGTTTQTFRGLGFLLTFTRSHMPRPNFNLNSWIWCSHFPTKLPPTLAFLLLLIDFLLCQINSQLPLNYFILYKWINPACSLTLQALHSTSMPLI